MAQNGRARKLRTSLQLAAAPTMPRREKRFTLGRARTRRRAPLRA
jgi:hypothetical protein